MQVGVGNQVDPDQLRAIASANQSYTVLIDSDFTQLTTTLTTRLTEILCNSKLSHNVDQIFSYDKLILYLKYLTAQPGISSRPNGARIEYVYT